MTLPLRLTKYQKRRFYREAVQQSLTVLYGKPPTVSKSLVAAWWKRLAGTEEFKSDLFMHSEPLHTAADLAHVEAIQIDSENEQVYRHILQKSRDRALEGAKPHEANRKYSAAAIIPRAFQVRQLQRLKRSTRRKAIQQKQLSAER